MKKFTSAFLILVILSACIFGCSDISKITNSTSGKIKDAEITIYESEEETSVTTIEETTEESETTVVETEPVVVEETVNMYEEGEEPVKTYFDKIDTGADSSSSDVLTYKRLSDDPITEFVPSTNNGPVFGFVGTSTDYISNDEFEEHFRFYIYGLVDSTGTIVCDPIYSVISNNFFKDGYYTERKVDGILYAGYISFDGSVKFEIPCYYTYFSSDTVFFYNCETNRIELYDRYGNYCGESMEVPSEYFEYEEYFWKGVYFFTSYVESECEVYCALTGEFIGISDLYIWRQQPGLFDDLIVVNGSYKTDSTYSVYDPTLGLLTSQTYKEITVVDDCYFCENTDGSVDILSNTGDLLNKLEYDSYSIIGDYVGYADYGICGYKILGFKNSEKGKVYLCNGNGSLIGEFEVSRDIQSSARYFSYSDKYFSYYDFETGNNYVFDYEMNEYEVPNKNCYILFDLNGEAYYSTYDDNSLVRCSTGTTILELGRSEEDIYCVFNVIDDYVFVEETHYGEDYYIVSKIYNSSGELIFQYIPYYEKFGNEF